MNYSDTSVLPSFLENPEVSSQDVINSQMKSEKLEQLAEVWNMSYLFNIKLKRIGTDGRSVQGKWLLESQMVEARAQHSLAICPDPGDPYNILVAAIGGLRVISKWDLFYKVTN